MATQPGKLSQFAGKKLSNATYMLADIENQPVIVDKASYIRGDFGSYVTFTATLENGVLMNVRTYAPNVVEAIHNAITEDALPVTATFKNDGRKWVVE